MYGINKFAELKVLIANNQKVISSSELANLMYDEGIFGGSKPSSLQRRFYPIFEHCRTEKGFYDLSKFDESLIPEEEGKTSKPTVDGKTMVEKLLADVTKVAKAKGYVLEYTLTKAE